MFNIFKLKRFIKLKQIIFALIIFCLSLLCVACKDVSALKAETDYNNISVAVVDVNLEEEIATTETSTTTQQSNIANAVEDLKLLEIYPEFLDWLEINPDTVGWITIENTQINYPVVFCGNNDDYLKQDFYGKSSKYGAIFMEGMNTGALLDENTIIHGHSFQYDSYMFGDLEKFKNLDFFNNNKIIKFNNLYSQMEWEIFAVYVVSAEEYSLPLRFDNFEDYKSYLSEKVKPNAKIWREFTPKENDKILTLQTCSYEFKDAHTLIQARLIKKTDNLKK